MEDRDKQATNPEERYRYIGFEVFGGKPQNFWKDESERKGYIERIKAAAGAVYRNSVVYSRVISRTDRIFITIASFLMIIAPFLPWFRAKTLYESVTFLGITGIFGLGGFWFYISKMGGWIVPVTIYLLAAMSYTTIIFGVMSLLAVYRKAASEEAYLMRLKKTLKLNIIPFLIFIVIVLLSLFGQRIPFGGSLGIQDLSGRYSIVTLVQFSSVGFWLAFFGALLNFNKWREL